MTELLKLGFIGSTKIYIGKENYKNIQTLMPKQKMSEHQRFELLNLIADGYYNTNIDTDDFACEFYSITNLILDRGHIPLELEYLAIEELHEEILNILGGC